MGIDISVDLSHGFNQLHDRFQNGQLLAGNQAMLEMEQFVPRKNGFLRDSVQLKNGGKTIVYKMPYAGTQFYGLVRNKYRIHKYTTPGTGRRWDLRVKGDQQKMSNIKHAFIEGSKL